MDNKFHTVRGYQLITKNKKLLTPSMEDYLEMIYRLCIKDGYVRIKTLAEKLNVKDSSVTKMVQKLSQLQLLEYKKYGIITLTEEGKELGSYLLKRHKIVEEFLTFISETKPSLMEIETMEHNLSTKVFTNIQILLSFFEDNTEIKNKFQEYRGNFNS